MKLLAESASTAMMKSPGARIAPPKTGTAIIAIKKVTIEQMNFLYLYIIILLPRELG